MLSEPALAEPGVLSRRQRDGLLAAWEGVIDLLGFRWRRMRTCMFADSVPMCGQEGSGWTGT